MPLPTHPCRPGTTTALRVLFVDVASRPAGAERSLALLIRTLGSLGVQCALVGAGNVRPNRRMGDGWLRLRTLSLEPRRRPGPVQAMGLLSRWLCGVVGVTGAILRFQPRVVHANTTAAALVSVLPAWFLRRPFIWHVRDLVPLGWLGRLLAKRASRVIAVSRGVRNSLVQEGVPAGKVTVIYNGTDRSSRSAATTDRARLDLRERCGFPPSAFVYLNVGRHLPWKRQDRFLDAAARLAVHCPRARFLIVGDEPSDERGCRLRLEEQTRRTGLSDRVRFLGPQDEMETILSGADVLVHTASREPFGRVLIEAMAVGVPVVAVRDAGPAEIIQPGISGLLAEPGDIDGLVAAMVRLERDPEWRDRLRRGGCERVACAFTSDRVGREVREVYRRMVAGLPGRLSNQWAASRGLSG